MPKTSDAEYRDRTGVEDEAEDQDEQAEEWRLWRRPSTRPDGTAPPNAGQPRRGGIHHVQSGANQ